MNLKKFCVRYGIPVMTVMIILVPLLTVIPAVVLEIPTWIPMVCALLIELPVILIITLYPARAIDRAVKQLNEACDPYPLLAETAEQLSCGTSKNNTAVLTIDYCVALYETGEDRQALSLLQAYDINSAKQTPLYMKIIYFHNLASYYYMSGQADAGDACLYQTRLLRQSLKGLQKMCCEQVLGPGIDTMIEAERLYARGQFDEALAQVSAAQTNSQRSVVAQAMLTAQILFAQGRPQAARVPLQTVLRLGNRLSCVQTAARLLQTIEQA